MESSPTNAQLGLERSSTLGEQVTAYLQNLAKQYPMIAEVRGLGAMIAIELMKGGKPSPELTASLVAKARDKGLILLSCGIYGNVVRILMPLTVPDEQLKRGLAILAESIAELA